jgi:hypothetical protein
MPESGTSGSVGAPGVARGNPTEPLSRNRMEYLMSELAFDREGNPFRFSRRTKKLRPRRWKNPGQRGTCAAVLDADGEQIFIEADAEYVEFRSTVGNVPGFYRLDQCVRHEAQEVPMT